MVVLAATSIGGAAQAAAAADILVALLSLASYAFYIFCGVALCYSVIMFKKNGDTNELIRGLLGAALFCGLFIGTRSLLESLFGN